MADLLIVARTVPLAIGRHCVRSGAFDPDDHKKSQSFLIGFFYGVGSTGEMSNQIWDDLIKIYTVAKKLGF